MFSSAQALEFFQAVGLAGSVLTAFTLLRSGLYKQYQALFWYMAFRIPNSLWPLWFAVNSNVYFVLWVVTTPIVLVFYILIVLELCRLILEKHKGLYSLGRLVMYGSTIVAVTVSILTLLPKFTPSIPQKSRYLGYGIALDRGVESTVLIFLALVLAFLSRYPMRLSRNVLVHTGLCIVFFLCSMTATLLRTVFGVVVNDEINLFLVAASAACTLVWGLLLTSHGEEVRTNLPSFGPEHEERVLEKLASLNRTLLKVPRN
jgi:hypothetical protein